MGDFDESSTVEITGKIMVIAIIILFIVVVFVLFLHLYAKWFWWRIAEQPTGPTQSRRNRRRFVFTPGQEPPLRRGLELSVLKSLPIVNFQSKEFEDGLECAVCLSEIIEGEKTRLLPKCNHGFHVDCIDMWFQSHSTCPLCRNSVAPQQQKEECSSDLDDDHDLEEEEVVNIPSQDGILASGYSNSTTESPNFPTNVLFWGDQTQVSTGGSGNGGGEEGSSLQASSSTSSSSSDHEMLVIDIPVQISEHFTEEESNNKSPMPTQRLRSLKRLLSREKKVAPSTSSSSIDV